MKCDEIRENLAAYLDGEIEGASRRTMDAHFATCPACLVERKAQAAAWRLLDLAAPPPSAPAGQKDRILARARAAGPTGGGRVLHLRPRVAAAAAAVLLAAGTTAFVLHHRGSDAAPPEQLLENLAVLESLDLLEDADVGAADRLAEFPEEDLEALGG